MTSVIVVLVERGEPRWGSESEGRAPGGPPDFVWNVVPELTRVYQNTDAGRGLAREYAVGLDPNEYSYQIEVCDVQV